MEKSIEIEIIKHQNIDKLISRLIDEDKKSMEIVRLIKLKQKINLDFEGL